MLDNHNASPSFAMGSGGDASIFGVNQLPDILGIVKSKLQQSAADSGLFTQVFGDKANTAELQAVRSHSVYRILSECVAALKDSYELTLIHLGDRNLDIDTQYFQEVKYLQFQNGKFDLSCLYNNDFAVIYYPDIGMLPESILSEGVTKTSKT